jgi:hypothetical protein
MRRAFALLEIVAVVVVIMMLMYVALRLNPRKNKPQYDRQTEAAVQGAGINTQNYITIKESMKDKVDQITQQHSQDLDAAGKELDR